MTDNEIIKALECCKCDDCDNCPNDFGNCYANLAGYALDLINRQKAEIERLVGVIDKTDAAYFQKVDEVKRAKAEAVKEFAERLKDRKSVFYVDSPYGDYFDGISAVSIGEINALIKEMVGDNNG